MINLNNFMVSVIIPSRSDQYLQKTVDDLLAKAKGEIEVIVVCDGRWPDPMLKQEKNVIVIHSGEIHDNRGMRDAINTGMRLAKGEYVMKCDEHTMWDEGWDEKLKADCGDTDVVVPRRYRLDAEKWEIIEDGRPPVDYMYIAYPYERPYDRRCGLYGGGIDKQRTEERKDVLIDETMSMQGSAYFMKKSNWIPLDDEKYGSFNHEAQEIHFRVQLSGGRLLVNKKTWYAHLHKGKKGKGYGFSREQYKKHEAEKEKARRYALDYWLTTKDFKHDFKWLIDKFNPPGWENWEERMKEDEKHDWRHDPSKQPSEWMDLERLKE